MNIVHKTYKYKLRPNSAQQAVFMQWLGSCRFLYNVALEHRITAWQSARVSVSMFDQSKQLTEAKREEGLEWLNEPPRKILEDTLDRVDRSFQNFFKSGAGFPKFAPRDRYRSFTISHAIKVEDRHVKLPKLGRVRYYNSRPVEGKVKRATVTKELDGWFICILCEQEAKPRPNDKAVGIDIGVERLATLSDGTWYENPKVWSQHERQIRILQRKLARQVKGSNRREETKRRLAKLYQKIRRKRKHNLHEVTSEIAGQYPVVFIEGMNLKGLTKSSKGSIEFPGKRVKQKSGLSRALLDASLGEFTVLLEQKVKAISGELVKVHPPYTSQRCSECGHVEKGNRLKQEEFICLGCGYEENADLNAAKNMLVLGEGRG